MEVLERLKEYQLNIILVLSSICGLLAFFVLITKALPPVKKRILVVLELSAMFLLIADRFAYFYRGDPSDAGYYMVRICNFLAFFFVIAIIAAFTMYLMNMYRTDGELTYRLEKGTVTITTEYCGLSIRSVTTVPAGVPTDIHIIR